MTHIRAALRRLCWDERGFVTGFFIRTTIAFAIVAVAINDVGQILITTVHAHNGAGAAAQAAANTFKGSRSLTAAHEAAVQALLGEDPSAKLLKVTVNPTNGVVIAVVRDTASTLVVGRVSFLEHFDVVRASEEETPDSL